MLWFYQKLWTITVAKKVDFTQTIIKIRKELTQQETSIDM